MIFKSLLVFIFMTTEDKNIIVFLRIWLPIWEGCAGDGGGEYQ